MRAFSLVLLSALAPLAALAETRPNILWITSEDNAAHWLGCYGNEQASTPRLDRLAAEGVRFRHAYANAPVCAVARFTIFTGAHAPSQGTQHMRSRHPIQPHVLPYAHHLREAGYYCSNASKTDYNFKGDDKAWWDDCSEKAHYRNRAEGQPFFAVFNDTTTHESSLFPAKRGRGPYRLKPEDVAVPPHLPDLPEVRADIAVYHDMMSQMDARAGRILDELEKAGLAEDTIVFYYSDHGGPMARGKRYLEDTGTRVPMIIRVPEKWRARFAMPPGTVSDDPVSFVDLAPTVLSVAGIKPPRYMQGRALMGEHIGKPGEGVFLYADRFDEIYGMRRGWTDGRWKYIRRFTPHLPAAPYSNYQFSMPSWVAWREAWQAGALKDVHRCVWEAPQPVEELFDLEADPWEMRNLATDPRHAERLAEMRGMLKWKMAGTRDTGVVPEPMFARLADGRTLAEVVHAEDFDFAGVLDLAFAASSGKEEDAAALKEALRSNHPAKRHWALLGLLIRGGSEEARPLLEDDHSINRVLAAEALHAVGAKEDAAKALGAEIEREHDPASALYLLNAVDRLNMNNVVPDEWVVKTAGDPRADEYLKRFAAGLKAKRGL